jgi:hypothetical protein
VVAIALGWLAGWLAGWRIGRDFEYVLFNTTVDVYNLIPVIIAIEISAPKYPLFLLSLCGEDGEGGFPPFCVKRAVRVRVCVHRTDGSARGITGIIAAPLRVQYHDVT